MSESEQPEQSPANAAATTAESSDITNEMPEEWKPEPREWTWKDLFTAPMLAFKPKCMVISVVTLAVIMAFAYLWYGLIGRFSIEDGVPLINQTVVGSVFSWVGIAILAAMFGFGATLVSVFFKADLLDDEFLSLGEAIGQFKTRLTAAIMVPLFLVAIVAGFNLFMYVAQLVGSIPIAGGIIYSLLFPLGVILALFTILLTIGALLSIFVGPAVVAIRRHGWFDNVIDTFEAVGTKPHVLVANLALSLVMVIICYSIGHYSMHALAVMSTSSSLPGHEISKVEARASAIADHSMRWFDITAVVDYSIPGYSERVTESSMSAASLTSEEAEPVQPGFVHLWISGLLTGFWKTLFAALIAGYALNVLLAGGMLTYLAVREDDYWDDEDLEDLDQLAKELEEEAKREEEAAKAAAAESSEPAAEAKSEVAAKPEETPDATAETTPATTEAPAEKPAEPVKSESPEKATDVDNASDAADSDGKDDDNTADDSDKDKKPG